MKWPEKCAYRDNVWLLHAVSISSVKWWVRYEMVLLKAQVLCVFRLCRLLSTIRNSYCLQIYSLRGTVFWLLSSVPSNKTRGLLDHLVDISLFSETPVTICRPLNASYSGRLEFSSTRLWETEILHRIIVHS